MVFPASATVKVIESELALQPSYCSMGSGEPYQKHTLTSSTAGNLRPWVGAQVIGTVDIGLVKVACSKAGVSFHENIQIYFYSGGNSEFCYGSIRCGFCWRACKGWSAVDKLAFDCSSNFKVSCVRQALLQHQRSRGVCGDCTFRTGDYLGLMLPTRAARLRRVVGHVSCSSSS